MAKRKANIIESACRCGEGKVTELKPLYSQEYVSALLARIEELEGKEKARTKLIEDTWNNIPMWQPPKHTGRGA